MEHPDIIKLENKLNSIWEDRDNQAIRDSLKKEQNIDEEIPAQMFYCSKCSIDYFPIRVIKVEQQDWNTNGIFRFWRAKHNCGNWNVRLISQKVNDKFFIKSPSVCRDRRKHLLDMLQIQDTGFDMLYRKHV